MEKKIICGVTRAGCGPANPILNLLRWTPPLAASTSVNVPCSIVPFTFGFDPGSVLHIPLPAHLYSTVPDVRHDGASHYTQSLIVLIIWTEACYCEVCFNLAGCIARLVYLWSDTQTLASTASAVLTSFHLPQSKGVYVTHT